MVEKSFYEEEILPLGDPGSWLLDWRKLRRTEWWASVVAAPLRRRCGPRFYRGPGAPRLRRGPSLRGRDDARLNHVVEVGLGARLLGRVDLRCWAVTMRTSTMFGGRALFEGFWGAPGITRISRFSPGVRTFVHAPDRTTPPQTTP